jgi:hypothetical protein
MNSMLATRVRTALAFLLLTVGFVSAASAAATSDFKVYLDLDNDQTTGCALLPTLSPTFTTADEILDITINVGATRSVAGVTRLVCNPGTHMFVPATAPAAAIGQGLGTPVGNTPSDVIETSLALTGTGAGKQVRIGYTSIFNGNNATDQLLTLDGTPAGAPIVLQLIPDVPALGNWGLLLLALLLTGSACLVIRRRGHQRAAMLLLVLTLGGGLAWAAGLVVDGNPGDWTGVDAVIATDVAGDAAPNADIVKAFAALQLNVLYLRIDALFETLPSAVNDSYATLEGTALNVAAPGVLANDGGDNLTATAQTAAPTSQGGTVTLATNGGFTYTPAAGFVGVDTFTYTATNSSGSSNATVSITVSKETQTISFTSTAPAGATVGGATYNATATATSGLPVTLTIDPSASAVCSISGSTVSFIGIGTCVIDANQPGNGHYSAAPQVQQSFPVGQGGQTISFTSTAPASATVGGPTYTATATATSGLPVALTIDPSASAVCTISGSTVSFTGVGTCVIDANQPGDANYSAAPQVQQSFAVGQGAQTITFTSTAPAAAAVGGPTYTVTATASSGLTVALTIDPSASAVCTISGSTVSFIGVGTCVVDANQPGDANYTAAPQAQQSFAVGKGTQTITFTSTAPAGATVAGPTYTVTATASSGLPVALTIDPSASAVCTISGSTVSFTGVGTCVIDANQAGDANYNPATQVQQSFPVGKGSQTISFTSTAPAAATVGGPTYTVTATATSSLPVALTIDPSASTVCTISGSTVSFIGVGTCVIDANQAGNANYNAATQVQQSFLVGKGTQTISFTSTAPAGASVGGATYTVTATATPSGLPVAFTIDPSASAVCTISGSTVSFIGVGTCVIDANQAGNANYNAAPQAQQSFPVAKGNQTISFTSTAPAAAAVGGATYTVTATATSGLPVAFTIDPSASTVCTISGSTVSFIGVGTCVVDANQAGNANYNAAPQAQQSFAVAKGSQTISFTSTAPAGATVAGPTYTVTATATSGLPVTFTIDPSASTVCTISGSTVSFIGAGTCVIDANQPGNANYNAAPQAQQSFPVVKGSQTINFTSTAPAGAAVGGPTYTVTATATSGLPVSFTIDASATSVCSIAGSTVSFIGVGTCVIDANQAGNANFNAAPQVQQSFAVGKGSQTISFTSTPPVGAVVGGPTYTVTATATSGLPVTFSIDPSASAVCTISGSTVSFIGAGTCVIDANQAGNANYNAAPQAQQSFPVGKGSQTISFTSTPPVGAVVGGPTYTVTATATSGLPVVFTIDASATSVCTISGSTVSFIGAGTCVIDANQPGNANFNAAPQVQQSVAVGKGAQTISFTSTPPASPAVGGTYVVSATATSGLTVTFTIAAASASVCSISGSTVTFIGTGTCTINANQAGNANYTAAPQVQQSFTVNQAPQITSANATSFTSTVPGSFTVTTTGFPTGASMVITETGALPNGVTFVDNNNGTATLAGTPAAMTQGTYPITIMANNGIAPAATQSFTLTVLNNPPQLVASPKETFDTVGNTQLQFAAASNLPTPSIFVAGNLVSNFTDADGPSTLSAVAVNGGATTNGGTVTINTAGEFTYTPKAGDLAASDTFQYQVTDGASTVTRTVTVNLKSRVWYVKNNAAAGGQGRSNDPFTTLAQAQAASLAGDYIFVYGGNLTNTGQAAGFVLKANQKLYGEAFGLTVANTINGVANPTLVMAAAGNRPVIDNTAASSDGISATNVSGVEVRGVSVSGAQDAIDLTTNGANSGGITITDNVIRQPGIDGIHVAAGGTGAVTLAISNNAITGNVRGMNLLKTAGTMTITAFANNAIDPSSPGSGIVVDGAIFDATPGNPINTVSGGTTTIGASGNGVGANGMLLTNVIGDLSFTDLDIVNDAGAGLRVTSTGQLNAGAGTGFRLVVGSGVGTIDSNGGPAIDISNASINLPSLGFLRSTNSTTTGVSLVNAFGGVGGTTLSAASGQVADPVGASGTAFNVDGGNGNVSFGGPIFGTSGFDIAVANRTGDTVSFTGAITDNAGAGSGISLTNNTGATISFTGTVALSTGTNAAFTATGGGTVTATDATSTLTTTTGTALNVANTTIGAGGLKFRSISANGAASGIVLNNTGASGSLTVSGTGSAGSGGTIQNTTSHGISLTSTLSPSFSWMTINNSGGSGVKGTTVTNFNFTNGTINTTGAGTDESSIAFNTAVAGTENNVSGTVTITSNSLTNSVWHGVDIQNFNGTLSNLTISNNTITSPTTTAGSKGSGIRVQPLGSATTAATITKATLANNVITNFPSGAGILAQGGNANAAGPVGNFGIAGSAGSIISITGNQIQGQSSANKMGTSSIIATVSGKGQGNFDVSTNGTVANPLANMAGTAILCGGNGDTTSTFTVNNNVIVANNTVASNGIGGGTGVTFGTTDTPDMTWTITGNNISATDGNGILTVARGATGSLKVKIQNNTVAAPLTGVREGIRIDAGNASSVNDSVCLNISGNTSAGSGGVQGIGLRKQGTVPATNAFGVNGMAATSTPGVETYVNGLNPAGNGTLLLSATSGFSNCSLP